MMKPKPSFLKLPLTMGLLAIIERVKALVIIETPPLAETKKHLQRKHKGVQ